MNRLVYLSPVPWDSFAQRSHKFVECFHERTGGSVLWLEPYAIRFPQLKDLRRASVSVANHHIPTPDWLQVIDPGAIPIEPLPGSVWLNRLVWRGCIAHVDDFVAENEALLVIGKPSVLATELHRRLKSEKVLTVYDAMDDFPAFHGGLSSRSLARREREMAAQVDAIWASSTCLQQRWQTVNRQVQLIHNGVDVSMLPGSTATPSVSQRAVWGYVGTMGSWFDWEWVCALAEVRPEGEVRLMGPIFEPPPRTLPSNVRLLEARDQPSAIQAMTEFTAGLIPFKRNRLTASVDPIKYYEYRSMGLPVLSTNFGEMSVRSDEPGVYISDSPGDLVELTQQAMQYEQDANLARRFAEENSWQARFTRALQSINC